MGRLVAISEVFRLFVAFVRRSRKAQARLYSRAERLQGSEEKSALSPASVCALPMSFLFWSLLTLLTQVCRQTEDGWKCIFRPERNMNTLRKMPSLMRNVDTPARSACAMSKPSSWPNRSIPIPTCSGLIELTKGPCNAPAYKLSYQCVLDWISR